jgi:hypothetical protein
MLTKSYGTSLYRPVWTANLYAEILCLFNIITTFGNIFFKFKIYFQFFECLLYKNLSRHKKCNVVVIFPWNLPTNATLVSNKLLILSDNRCGFGAANNSTFEDNVQINIMCAHLLGLAENTDCALNNEKLWTQLKENPGEVPRGSLTRNSENAEQNIYWILQYRYN